MFLKKKFISHQLDGKNLFIKKITNKRSYISPSEDYYTLLDVPKTATKSQIFTNFMKFYKKYHFEKNEEMLKLIGTAYENLSDQSKRDYYDKNFKPLKKSYSMNQLTEMFTVATGQCNLFEGEGDEESRYDILNITVDQKLSFEELIKGCEKEITFDCKMPCPTCSGSGLTDGGVTDVCLTCEGDGALVQGEVKVPSYFCSECEGAGDIVVSGKCTNCKGQGVVRKKRKLLVKIPGDIEHGDRITFPRDGHWFIRKNFNQRGDLNLFIKSDPHLYYQRKGNDLIATWTATLGHLMLGFETEIETPLGQQLRLVIPRGSKHGDRITFKGKGVKGGDVIFEIMLVVPKLPEEATPILSELKQAIPPTFKIKNYTPPLKVKSSKKSKLNN